MSGVRILLPLAVALTACPGPTRVPDASVATGAGSSRNPCRARLVAMRGGFCRGFEKINTDSDQLTRHWTVPCGSSVQLCGATGTCNCDAPIAFQSCSPTVPEFWPYEDGRTYSSQQLAAILQSGSFPPRTIITDLQVEHGNESCVLRIREPEYGACSISGAISSHHSITDLFGAPLMMNEEAEYCGVRLRCVCPPGSYPQ